ncbi:MAG: glutathione S-transferase family protein [Rhizobiaceae bacterium]|nr:glutathione S-transferase family protein [Rhizobiaceae bacterium]
MALHLHGYRFSVYLRIAAMTLTEKGLDWTHVEVNPFNEPVPDYYRELHPFGRVPTLVHDGFAIYETTAITRYIDEAFPGKALQPAEAAHRARMNQIIAVADSYGYWPMVRQVFAQRVFAPATGHHADEKTIAEGLEKSATVLAALDRLVAGEAFLVGSSLTLADLHLGAMMAYFVMAGEGAAELARHDRLATWWASMSSWHSLRASDPGLPSG